VWAEFVFGECFYLGPVVLIVSGGCVVEDISNVNTGENSPEQVSYQLMKDIQASGVVSIHS
jgi:hypothetical protein